MTPFEAVVAADLIRDGYKVLANGWPDFCAVRRNGNDIQVRFIEVKGVGDVVRSGQQKMHDVFCALGFSVEIVRENPKQRMDKLQSNPSSVFTTASHESEVNRGGRPNDAIRKAMDFLERALPIGQPRIGKHVARAAYDEENISRSTLYRAADALSIKRTNSRGLCMWARYEHKSENEYVFTEITS